MTTRNTLLSVAAALGCLLATSGTAMAATHSGTISLYHLNGTFPGRGVCVQTVPALPTTWACIYKTNALYEEITELLLQGFLSQRACKIWWNTLDPNALAIIYAVECS